MCQLGGGAFFVAVHAKAVRPIGELSQQECVAYVQFIANAMLNCIEWYLYMRWLWKLDCGDDTGTVVNAQGNDVSYSTRHVEESWHHLMKSEDTAKFKQIAVCNFDFLLAAVSVATLFIGVVVFCCAL